MRRNGAGSAAYFFRDFSAGWYTSGIAIATGDGKEDATARLVALHFSTFVCGFPSFAEGVAFFRVVGAALGSGFAAA